MISKSEFCMLSPIQRKYNLDITISQNFNYFIDKAFI